MPPMQSAINRDVYSEVDTVVSSGNHFYLYLELFTVTVSLLQLLIASEKKSAKVKVIFVVV